MPYANDIHIDTALTNISVKYRNESYIADMLFPNVPVKKESDKYYVFSRDNFRLPETLRANKAKANEVSWNVSQTSYSLNEHALADLISDRDRGNADEPLDMDIETTEFLTDLIMLRREKLSAALAFTTTTWSLGHSLTSTMVWSLLTTTTDPIGDVKTGTAVVVQNSGLKPNTLVVGFGTFKSLCNHPNILDRIKYSERGVVTADILAAVFDVNRVIVGQAIEDTAQEGLTSVNAFIWNDKALLAYVNPAPGLRKVSAGYNLQISGAGVPYKTKKWREEPRGGDMVEVSTMFAPKAVATLCAYLINNTD